MMTWLTLASRTPQRPPTGWELTAQELFKDAFTNVNHTFPVTGVLLAMGGLLTVLLAVWGWRRAQQRRLSSGPTLIFHRIANRIGLDLQQQWLLLRISRHESLPSPLTLLLSGATLEYHAHHFLAAIAPRRRSTVSAQITRITRKLFSE